MRSRTNSHDVRCVDRLHRDQVVKDVPGLPDGGKGDGKRGTRLEGGVEILAAEVGKHKLNQCGRQLEDDAIIVRARQLEDGAAVDAPETAPEAWRGGHRRRVRPCISSPA